MIDVLLVHKFSSVQIGNFLSEVFDCSLDRIEVFDIDEFNSLTEELDDSLLDCVCVVLPVRGDVSQLLQLYKYEIPTSVVIDRIIDITQKKGILCYIPSEASDAWIGIGAGSPPKLWRQIEGDEEDCFLLQPM